MYFRTSEDPRDFDFGNQRVSKEKCQGWGSAGTVVFDDTLQMVVFVCLRLCVDSMKQNFFGTKNLALSHNSDDEFRYVGQTGHIGVGFF